MCVCVCVRGDWKSNHQVGVWGYVLSHKYVRECSKIAFIVCDARVCVFSILMCCDDMQQNIYQCCMSGGLLPIMRLLQSLS